MKNFFRRDFDYEEDDFDRLENRYNNKAKNKYTDFTNKSTKKKVEFDYEEDPYEPESDFDE